MKSKIRAGTTLLGAICALGMARIYAAADESTAAQPTAVRDGSRDFDFIYGKWSPTTS